MRSDSKLLEAFAPLHPFLSETVQQPLNFRPFCALEEKCRVCYGVLPYASGILEKTDETEVQQSAGVS
jgi:hypothetical protein